MRVGICGGTFDPFHRGHLDPVLAVCDTLAWDRIVYIPAYRQPFKTDSQSTSAFHRFAMTVLATEGRDRVRVSPMELERGAISYTVDTLEELRGTLRGDTLDWIIGDDNLSALGEWRNLQRIFDLANFVVLTRGNAALPAEFKSRVTTADARAAHGSIVFAHNATVPISSTEIRNRVRAGEAIDAFVDPRVSRYIHHNRLYSEALT
jgi:nicotinate-nucleotide adenylyltransferase